MKRSTPVPNASAPSPCRARKCSASASDVGPSGLGRTTYNQLLEALFAVRDRKAIWSLIEEMQSSQVCPNRETCSLLLNSLKEGHSNSDIEQTFAVLDRMQDPVDEALFSTAVRACVRVSRLDMLFVCLKKLKDQGCVVLPPKPGMEVMMMEAFRGWDSLKRVWQLWSELSAPDSDHLVREAENADEFPGGKAPSLASLDKNGDGTLITQELMIQQSESGCEASKSQNVDEVRRAAQDVDLSVGSVNDVSEEETSVAIGGNPYHNQGRTKHCGAFALGVVLAAALHDRFSVRLDATSAAHQIVALRLPGASGETMAKGGITMDSLIGHINRRMQAGHFAFTLMHPPAANVTFKMTLRELAWSAPGAFEPADRLIALVGNLKDRVGHFVPIRGRVAVPPDSRGAYLAWVEDELVRVLDLQAARAGDAVTTANIANYVPQLINQAKQGQRPDATVYSGLLVGNSWGTISEEMVVPGPEFDYIRQVYKIEFDYIALHDGPVEKYLYDSFLRRPLPIHANIHDAVLTVECGWPACKKKRCTGLRQHWQEKLKWMGRHFAAEHQTPPLDAMWHGVIDGEVVVWYAIRDPPRYLQPVSAAAQGTPRKRQAQDEHCAKCEVALSADGNFCPNCGHLRQRGGA